MSFSVKRLVDNLDIILSEISYIIEIIFVIHLKYWSNSYTNKGTIIITNTKYNDKNNKKHVWHTNTFVTYKGQSKSIQNDGIKKRDINLLVKIYCTAFNTIPFNCKVLLPMCFPIIKHALKSFLWNSFRVHSEFSFIVLMTSKQWPLRGNFNHSNNKKSKNAISGEYRAFGAVSVEYLKTHK